MNRLPGLGRVDRERELQFTFDGRQHTGYAGDTLASALLASGERTIARSIGFRRPRGIVSAGIEEPNAIVAIDSPYTETAVAATMVELVDGLAARSLSGKAALASDADEPRYDRRRAHCDVLVIGAGPAGLAAAIVASRAGARVVLVDDQPEAGGSLLGEPDPMDDWVQSMLTDLNADSGAHVLTRTSAFGCFDDGFVLALERRVDDIAGMEPRGATRLWQIRAKTIVTATGAHERLIAFADNDRPGIMLAGAARTYLHRFGVLPAKRVVVFTTNDSGLRVAAELAQAGAEVSVVDPRDQIAPHWQRELSRLSVDTRLNHVVTGTSGDTRVSCAHVAARSVGGVPGRRSGIRCDLLLVSGGWNPAVQLFSQAGGAVRFDEDLAAFVPAAQTGTLRAAGAAAGVVDLAGCLRSGAEAAHHVLAGLGLPQPELALPETPRSPEELPGQPLWAVPDTYGQPDRHRFVDLHRDATVGDIARAVDAGLTSIELVKRYTTIGTGYDQGRTANVLTAGVLAERLRSIRGCEDVMIGTTRFRPPYLPVSFAALASRERGELFDPVRVTAIHPWHVEHGAVFENVGQWKRPWYYPKPGEGIDAAVERECRAARTGVAVMDASTLGKIDVQGPDAGEFLDRLYTNLMNSLKVGSIRYGVMCGVDGMVLDDGVVMRLAEDRFLLTTTTGNAAAVLDWMERWLQTESPELRASLTSVTEHWATVPLVGPRSRDVLAAVTTDFDVSNESFPFMTWQDTSVAGRLTRICRVTFSGELAYEINVSAWDALHVWQALMDAGHQFGITAYGTQTMHVLRAEKGYPIIGQDTDGTVTPQDLGMSWVISKSKVDFIGKRSHSRTENLRADRRQLVGLLPIDPDQRLVEGAHVLADEKLPAAPVTSLGHVTSAYRSAAMNRTFGLALVAGGRERLGEVLYAWDRGQSVPVLVCGPVLYDKAGEKRDG